MSRSRPTRMTRTIVPIFCLAFAGCVSVPLSTIVRMSTFDERDFVQLDPEVVRVKVTLPQGFHLDATRSWLGVDIDSPAGVHHGEFKLDRESTQRTEISAGLFAGTAAATAYTLRLSGPSRNEFRSLQGFVGRGPPGQITIRVVPILSAFPDDVASVKVWIDLLLSQSQGYFTLVEGADVPMEQIRAASRGT